MIIVLGRVEVEPEAREDFVWMARAVEAATRQEQGCLSYSFAQDLTDPNLFWLSESWTDLAAIEAHFETEHLAEFRKQNAALAIRSFVAKRYEGVGETVLVSR